MAQVIITIQPDGKTSVEAEGWTGPTCSTITKPYADALGKETNEDIKPEFYVTTTQQQQVNQ